MRQDITFCRMRRFACSAPPENALKFHPGATIVDIFKKRS